jgi:flagellar FliL protein
LILYRLLLVLVMVLMVVLVGGTLYALVFRDAHGGPLYRFTPQGPPSVSTPPRNEAPGQDSSTVRGIFTGIGRLRVATAPPQPYTVILSIAFPYDPEDRPFTEELATRVTDFRNSAIEYFGSHTVEELKKQDEPAIKAELLRRYNAMLHLGHIEALYFNDFMVIE